MISTLASWIRKRREHINITLTILAIMSMLCAPFAAVEASGNLVTVKDTLATSRPSVATTISSTITAGDTTINIGSTAGINQGDTVTLCNAGCSTTENRIVSAVLSATQLSLTVGATNTYASGNVYYKSKATQSITFTTRSAVSNGKFVVTIPGSNTTTPQSTGFALNNLSTTTDVSLSGATAGTISTSTSAGNLIFTIPFTGSVASTTAITVTIGNVNAMLNPTKTAAVGTADTFSFEVDEDDSGSNLIDTTSGDVATIEAVSVSATIVPSLTFSINAVAGGTNVIGYGTNAGTTATTVPFGNLTVNATTTLAQFLNVATNSNSGYIITAQEDGYLRKTNGSYIPDFPATTSQDNENSAGFGYSLANKVGTDSAFTYNTSGTFYGRGFSSTTPFTIMSNAGPVNGNQTYVLYRIKPLATYAQGTYQNLVTYIATASY